MSQILEESKEICEERMKMISNMIRMVMDNRMSWEALESLLNDMASSLSKSKQVNKILISELKALNSKFCSEVIQSDSNSIDNEVVTSESTKIDSQEKEVQNDFEENQEDISQAEVFTENQENILERNESEFFSNTKEEIRYLNGFIESQEIQSTITQNEQKREEFVQPNEPNREFENEFSEAVGDIKERKFRIPDCDQSKSSNEKKRKSKRTFECSICCKSFPRKGSLANHIRMHTGEKPFKCNYCGKHFICKSTLAKHIKIHTGTKSYQCKICFKSFVQKAQLKNHGSIHTGEKPYKCKACEKCFTRSTYLKIHERLHSEDKPYKCKFCEKSYIQISSLKTHETIHT